LPFPSGSIERPDKLWVCKLAIFFVQKMVIAVENLDLMSMFFDLSAHTHKERAEDCYECEEQEEREEK